MKLVIACSFRAGSSLGIQHGLCYIQVTGNASPHSWLDCEWRWTVDIDKATRFESPASVDAFRLDYVSSFWDIAQCRAISLEQATLEMVMGS